MPITPETTADAAHDAIDDAEAQIESIEGFIAERPLLSLGIAALIGFVLAKTIL
jgi:ElaB/YqjD/DUF883 family membrane-anchored ribosome-binding protein